MRHRSSSRVRVPHTAHAYTLYTPLYTLGTPCTPLYLPGHTCVGAAAVHGKWRSRHEKSSRFVMAPLSRKLHRLICGRLRCILRELSYHQSSNQLRKRRLRSFVRGYSAADYPGSSVTVLRVRSSQAAWNCMFLYYLCLCFMFHTVSLFYCFYCFTPTKGSIIDSGRLEPVKAV